MNTRHRATHSIVMYSPHRAAFEGPEPKPYLVHEGHGRIPSGRNRNSSHRTAAVYHYVTRSLQDWAKKQQRGGGAGVSRPAGYAARLDKAARDTCSGAQRTAQRLCPQLLTQRNNDDGSAAPDQKSSAGAVAVASGRKPS